MIVIVCVMSAILGLCVGSFLNVVIYRVPNGMSIALPPSHCPQCDYRLKWYDNIPVVSYILLGGKCRNCKQHISFRYTVVELLNMVLWTLLALQLYDNLLYLAVCCVAASMLVVVAFVDLEHMYIPDRFQLTLLVAGIVAIFADPSIVWWERLVGLGVGAALFGLFYGVSFIVYKREGMGLGDVKLAAVCGLLLGWKNLIVMVLVASLVGSVVLLALKYARKDEDKKEYPFAPFLSLGAIVAMLVGNYIVDWYLALCGIV